MVFNRDKMFTKTQAKIMESFISKINNKFSIKEIAESLKKPYPLIHRSIKPLIEQEFILKDNKELLSVNYLANHAELAYIESLRSKKWLKDKTNTLLTKDLIENINLDFFVLLVFGSSVESNSPRDIDILVIVDEKIDQIEKIGENIASNFTRKVHFNVISVKSAYEMLLKREKINVMNETLNKHLILFGAESYYRILKNARQ